MDPTLVGGLLTIAGTLCSGLLYLARVLVNRHLGLITKLETNDNAKTESLTKIAGELTRTREVQQEHAAKIASLEVALEDKRNSEAVAQSKVATAIMERALGHVTGQHAAVSAERLGPMTEQEVAEAPTAPQRRPLRTAPAR